MLTVYDFNRVTFAHHRGIVPPMPAQEGKKAVEKRYVCSANMKLMEYGYIMARDLFDACCKAEYNDFLKTWSALYDCVTEDGKAISRTSTIWPNFPNDAMEADLVDLYVVNFLNYLTCGEWQPDFDPAKFCPALDRSRLPAVKQVPACDEEEIYRYAVQSITGHSPLSPDEASCVFDTLMHDVDFTSELMDRMKPKHIPCKENLALYVSRIISRPEWREQACFRDFKSSTDVLRLAAAMSDQDVSLSNPPKFRSFKRGERRQLLELLEHADKNEGFALHPEEFKRLGERLHPGDYSYIFKEDYELFTKVRNSIKIETYNSKLQELMKKPVDVDLLSAHLTMRPGMFARNLDFALRNCSNEQQMESVLFRFISVCKSIEPRVLVQLINHFRNRNNPVHLATGKSNGAISKALERDIEPLSEDICKRVARDIFNQLWQVLRAEDTEPKSVYIDTDCHCNTLIFPDNPRQITSAMRAAACGSRTNLPDGNVLRAFLYWRGNDDPDLWDGIDLDLSVVFYGVEKAKFVYYGNPKDEALGAVHSGDRRCSGKNGAVEYVDFDIKKCLQNGFRYAALTVESYSGEKFSEMESAFCGVMVRDGETGKQFEPATVKDRFALTTDSDQLVMVVIDLMTREVITVDKSVAQFRLACRNVVTDYAPTVAACTYAMQLKSLSIKEMLGMRYAQFLKSDDWKHASVIVSDEPEKFKVTDKDAPAPRIVSPYDIPGIYDLIFGKENQ